MKSKTQTNSNFTDSFEESLPPYTLSSRAERRLEQRDRFKNNKLNKIVETSSTEEIESKLAQQIQVAERAILDTEKLFPLQIYQNKKAQLDDLKIMEESIRRKNYSIKEIEEEIKSLKNGTYFEMKKSTQGPHVLSYDVKALTSFLLDSQKQLRSKQKEAEEKKQSLRLTEERFKAKCKKQGIEAITYEEFKQIEIRKKKEQKKIEKLKKISSSKKLFPQFSSMKEIPEKDSKDVKNPEIITESKKLKDLLHNRNIAEAALKNAKKRHTLEINDLMGKIEFLRDEYQDLDTKLKIKENELRDAQKKFSEARINPERTSASRKYRTPKNL